MAVTAAQMKATRKYREKAYDRIEIQPKKGAKERYQREAEKRGISLTQFIIDCVEREITAPNAETIGAIEEVEEMIQTGTGEHFEGETAVFFDSILEG